MTITKTRRSSDHDNEENVVDVRVLKQKMKKNRKLFNNQRKRHQDTSAKVKRKEQEPYVGVIVEPIFSIKGVVDGVVDEDKIYKYFVKKLQAG